MKAIKETTVLTLDLTSLDRVTGGCRLAPTTPGPLQRTRDMLDMSGILADSVPQLPSGGLAGLDLAAIDTHQLAGDVNDLVNTTTGIDIGLNSTDLDGSDGGGGWSGDLGGHHHDNTEGHGDQQDLGGHHHDNTEGHSGQQDLSGAHARGAMVLDVHALSDQGSHQATEARDHRPTAEVRDHRTSDVVVRDHRDYAPVAPAPSSEAHTPYTGVGTWRQL
jgi:hypothetical protein